MPITYFQATRSLMDDDEQLTTLASGDDACDVRRLREHAHELGWVMFSIRKCVSTASGDERSPDGKDVYRHHRGCLVTVRMYMID